MRATGLRATLADGNTPALGRALAVLLLLCLAVAARPAIAQPSGTNDPAVPITERLDRAREDGQCEPTPAQLSAFSLAAARRGDEAAAAALAEQALAGIGRLDAPLDAVREGVIAAALLKRAKHLTAEGDGLAHVAARLHALVPAGAPAKPGFAAPQLGVAQQLLARRQIDAEAAPQARETLQRAFALIRRGGVSTLYAQVELAQLLAEAGAGEAAGKEFARLRKLVDEEIADPAQQALGWAALARAHGRLGEAAETESYLVQAMAMLDELPLKERTRVLRYLISGDGNRRPPIGSGVAHTASEGSACDAGRGFSCRVEEAAAAAGDLADLTERIQAQTAFAIWLRRSGYRDTAAVLLERAERDLAAMPAGAARRGLLYDVMVGYYRIDAPGEARRLAWSEVDQMLADQRAGGQPPEDIAERAVSLMEHLGANSDLELAAGISIVLETMVDTARDPLQRSAFFRRIAAQYARFGWEVRSQQAFEKALPWLQFEGIESGADLWSAGAPEALARELVLLAEWVLDQGFREDTLWLLDDYDALMEAGAPDPSPAQCAAGFGLLAVRALAETGTSVPDDPLTGERAATPLFMATATIYQR